MKPPSQSKPLLSVRPQTFRITFLALAALIAISAIQIGAPHWLGQEPGAIDYKIFHYVGELSRTGQPALPYNAPAFEAWQAARPGGEIFMPWTYPPQFALLTEGLSLLPVGPGYALFTGLTLAALVLALFRLAPATAMPALMLTLPAIVMNIRAGQNGFLTALLFALTCLFALRGAQVGNRAGHRAASGISLGLLAFKPHLGLVMGLVALFRGGWSMVLAAALTVATALALATLAFGPEIWAAFLQSLRDSGNFLRQGAYPMERMISAFALAFSLGLPAPLALAAQAAVALAVIGLLGLGLVRRWPLAHLLAWGCLAGPALSPYGYDYDLVALAPGLALALPALAAQLSGAARPGLIAALLLATGFGLFTVFSGLTALPALGALAYLAALALIAPALLRANRAA